MSKSVLIWFVLAGAVFPGLARAAEFGSAGAGSARAYLASPTGCGIVVGGNVGSQFSDSKINQIWSLGNQRITEGLFDQLYDAGYDVSELIISQTAKTLPQTTERVAKKQCNRVIQVSHLIGEDSGGAFFQFSIEQILLRPTGPGAGANDVSTLTVGEYKKAYRYPRTQEMLDTFSFSKFAVEVFRDLKQSGALNSVIARDQAGSVKVPAADIRQQYDRTLEKIPATEEYLVRQILVATREEALAVLQRLKGGEDFAEIAERVSLDRRFLQWRDGLEWIRFDYLGEEVGSVLQQLKPRGTSPEPIRSRWGWHIVELKEVKLGKETEPSYEAVRERIAAVLRQAIAAGKYSP